MSMQDMSKKVSVILTIYKVAKYLDACLTSVTNQTYTNLEIILVNDASPDNCGELCAAWAARDPRIRVLTHEQNRGLSAARNTGLDSATGDFIWFVDADDYCDVRQVELLLAAALRENAEVAVCDFVVVDEAGEPLPDVMPARNAAARVISGEESLMAGFDDRSCLHILVWNKLIRADLWDGVRFPEGRYADDEIATPLAVSRAARVAIIPDALYFYVKHAGSVSAGYGARYRVAYTEAMFLRMARAAEFGHAKFAAEGVLYWGRVLSEYAGEGMHRDALTRADFAAALRAFRAAVTPQLARELTAAQRVHLALISVSPSLNHRVTTLVRRVRGEK